MLLRKYDDAIRDQRCGGLGLGFWFVCVAWLGLATLTETVAETATHDLQVSAAAGTGGLPPLGLLRPVVCV